MAVAAILKIAFVAITHWRFSDFGEILCEEAEWHPKKATWQKLQIIKIQDGGRLPFWKQLNHHISVKILLDFDKIWCTTAYIEHDGVFKSAIAVSYVW